MNNKKFWFYLEPYTHISVKGMNSLVYNSISGKILEFNNNPVVSRFLLKLKSKQNLLVMKCTNGNKRQSTNLQKFIKRAHDTFMGDIIDFQPGLKKPIQIMPLLSVYKDISRLKKDTNRSVGEGVLSYLSELSLYLNNQCGNHCTNCSDSFKQFSFCRRDKSQFNELKPEVIKKILDETKGTSLNRLNILGGNLFNYSNIKSLVKYLNQIPILKIFYIHYLNMENISDVLELFEKQNSVINILVSFPIQEYHFEKIIQLISRLGIKIVFSVLLQSEVDIQNSQKLINKYKIENVLFYPYFNGKNLRFFKKHVFITRKKFLMEKPDLNSILVNNKLNSFFFGRLVVLSNGDAYADVNFKKLGNIFKNSLYEIIFQEMKSGKSWRRLRKNFEPCNQCVYELLCPPITSYETLIKRNNLCKIFPLKIHQKK